MERFLSMSNDDRNSLQGKKIIGKGLMPPETLMLLSCEE